MRRFAYIFIVVFILGLAQLGYSYKQEAVAQEDSGNVCTAIVEQAITSTQQFCSQQGRHTACYGNDLVDASPHASVVDFTFDVPGDVSDVSAIESLQLSGLNADDGRWGIVKMELQANIPSARPENVSAVVFGNVVMENAANLNGVSLPVTLTKQFGLDLRDAPAYAGDIVFSGEIDMELLAVQRTEDGEWLRVEVPESGEFAWARTSAVTFEGDVASLPVAGMEEETLYRPMQAFYFSAHDDSSQISCSEFPASGMLVQTPEGVAEISLLINEVNIELGSTAFISTEPGGEMLFALLEGHSTVTANGVAVDVPAGSFTVIPMDASLHANGRPADAQVMSEEMMARIKLLPLGLLKTPMTVTENGEVAAAELTTICHATGNEGGVTISVAEDALDSHLAHGDTEGACPEDTSPGNSGSQGGNPNEEPPGGGPPEDNPNAGPKK
ncbi:MAG: hypothetical protein L0154_02820 [Chloroflexi bacterium]|nr:hypothetical protein [Chloroflexota bacterium]